jgi:hypothetical protein
MKSVFKAGGLIHTLVKENNGVGIYQLSLPDEPGYAGYNIGKFNKRSISGNEFESFVFLKSAYTLSSAEIKLEELSK